MAATVIAEQAVAGPYVGEGESGRITVVTFTAGDSSNGNKVVMSSGRTLLLFTNTGTTTANVTIASSKDERGRKADIDSFAIAAGAFAAVKMEPKGWEQTVGGRDLLITPSSADIEILAIPL